MSYFWLWPIVTQVLSVSKRVLIRKTVLVDDKEKDFLWLLSTDEVELILPWSYNILHLMLDFLANGALFMGKSSHGFFLG
ncbi:hypothetical protein OPV22_029475 [Ensete ventricosum]|uniref:Uncharacterized protein n=1 Tax=Ensete ventricosum TaxID=4639 RepID=A0AAV8QBA3_ENSVE|nr:hypothetical protein OPV22_029475 [Ensete ventricosum]